MSTGATARKRGRPPFADRDAVLSVKILVRLSPREVAELDRETQAAGETRSELVRGMVRRHFGIEDGDGPGVVKVTIVDMKRRAAP